MLVYRLTRAKYTLLDGQAAKLYGGRWNHPGCALVYTAESRALAVLETRVHLNEPPADYVCMVIDVPSDVDDRRRGNSCNSRVAH
jgi:RES domain-containing protein